jgi:hypothetical protein
MCAYSRISVIPSSSSQKGSEDFNRRKTKGFEQKVAKVAKGTED